MRTLFFALTVIPFLLTPYAVAQDHQSDKPPSPNNCHPTMELFQSLLDDFHAAPKISGDTSIGRMSIWIDEEKEFVVVITSFAKPAISCIVVEGNDFKIWPYEPGRPA